MSITRAVIRQMMIFIIVAVDTELIRHLDAAAASGPLKLDSSGVAASRFCPEWRNAICEICSSLDPENRCCWEDEAYRGCIESLVHRKLTLSGDGEDGQWDILDKRAKYFLGKRGKYFLGKREQEEEEEEEDKEGQRRVFGEGGKRTKYFLGKR